MFWKLTSLSASSPVEAILDKENVTLEELLDEEDIIQECKALNSRLINFLRNRVQVEQLLRYIIEEPQEDADSKRTFKFPFMACEIFTCEIDVIFKTLVEDEELMDMLFSFLEPTRPHSALLAGYFSKVVICLMLRKTIPLMNYVQAHQYVFQQLVDLIGITSIMEVLVRLVGADEHIYPNSTDVMQWLADSNLLEMIVDKLSPSSSSEVHANAAETLCTITRNAPSPLASKLSSSSFVARIFGHALEDSHSKSGLVHSLSVCISLLDPKRSLPSVLFHSFRGQHVYEAPVQVNQETVGAMLPKLGDLLILLNVSLDEKVLPTTYGQLKPPLGKHRLKIVEFISVLLKTGNEIAEKELISSGTIQRVLDLFFEYPYNNALHHHVESIIFSCLESKNNTIIDHLFLECDLITKILQTDKNPILFGVADQPTLPAAEKNAPRVGNLGHVTRIANKITQLGNTDSCIQKQIQESSEWNEWQTTVLQERNMVENVYRWACGRPTALQDRNRDSDEDDIHDRDYDVAALANNLSQAFRYNIYDNDEGEEGHRTLDQDDEEGYFDDESAEVVISSLRLGDDQGSLFTNSNWFAFQNDNMADDDPTSFSGMLDEINLNGASSLGGNSSSDDEVVVGEDEELVNGTTSNSDPVFHDIEATDGDLKATASGGGGVFKCESGNNEDVLADRPGVNPLEDNGDMPSVEAPTSPVTPTESLSNDTFSSANSNDGSGLSDSSQKSVALFEEDVEFVGVEAEGTEKAMDQALKEGIVGEAGPLKRKIIPNGTDKDNVESRGGLKEFNDTNYWKVDQEVEVLE
uniref:serine/threonine-protein phosphatase 6 regulatory subunit 3-like isoform X2 n=1 Tax=Erigeron canadensis TaxID=72917 RepID=UPI001CB9489E|nr:serine/threonine-protein phosphatase 6 regulatory subunit 3-like isoform X2 [Erigeron canadensis]